MGGLNLRVAGGVQAMGQIAPYSTGDPTTISEAAFGSSSGLAAKPRGGKVMLPNDPAGVAFWAGIAGVGFLMFIRHSLPR